MPQIRAALPARNLREVRQSTRATLSVSEVADVLNVDPRTVSSAIAAGELPSVKLGRRLLIPREPFLSILDGKEVSAPWTAE